MKVLIVGHSYVKRLKSYIRKKERNRNITNFAPYLNVGNIKIRNQTLSVTNVVLAGHSGLKVKEPDHLRWVEDNVKIHRPDATCIELGTNDFTSEEDGPAEKSYYRVCTVYRKYRSTYQNIKQISKVVVGSQVISRPKLKRNRKTAYDRRRNLFNAMLRELEREDKHFVAHKHRHSSLKSLRSDISKDGIHPDTEKGLILYKKSVKDASVLAVKRMVNLGYL